MPNNGISMSSPEAFQAAQRFSETWYNDDLDDEGKEASDEEDFD
jgi:hypothetical protein